MSENTSDNKIDSFEFAPYLKKVQSYFLISRYEESRNLSIDLMVFDDEDGCWDYYITLSIDFGPTKKGEFVGTNLDDQIMLRLIAAGMIMPTGEYRSTGHIQDHLVYRLTDKSKQFCVTAT